MKHTFLLFALALVILAGCKKDSTTAASGLVGTWKDTTTVSGYPVYGTIIMNAANTFDFSMRVGTSTVGHSAGRYTSTSTQLHFQDTTNSSTSCYSTPCTYGYTSPTTTHFILSVITDSCAGRASANNGTNWYKQ